MMAAVVQVCLWIALSTSCCRQGTCRQNHSMLWVCMLILIGVYLPQVHGPAHLHRQAATAVYHGWCNPSRQVEILGICRANGYSQTLRSVARACSHVVVLVGVGGVGRESTKLRMLRRDRTASISSWHTDSSN